MPVHGWDAADSDACRAGWSRGEDPVGGELAQAPTARIAARRRAAPGGDRGDDCEKCRGGSGSRGLRSFTKRG